LAFPRPTGSNVSHPTCELIRRRQADFSAQEPRIFFEFFDCGGPFARLNEQPNVSSTGRLAQRIRMNRTLGLAERCFVLAVGGEDSREFVLGAGLKSRIVSSPTIRPLSSAIRQEVSNVKSICPLESILRFNAIIGSR
jgi:hypothetical protein